jgi:hypothetical protein
MEQGQGVRAAGQGHSQGRFDLDRQPGVEDGGDPFADRVSDLDR